MNVNPRDFYQNLSRKDKGRFLRYLSRRYDYPASTMSGKLREKPLSSLRRDEAENISKAIEAGAWKE